MSIQSTLPLVSVQVEQLLPFGLLVRLSDGRQGVVREREIAWEHHARRGWREHYRPGDRIDAVILDARAEGAQRVELSLRLAKDDPWTQLDPGELCGRLVEGIVTGTQPYGAFVEVRPGIVGLLHHARLPGWAQCAAVDELIWVGDHVRVVVERIDLARRQLTLSLSRATAMRWQDAGATLAPEHAAGEPQRAPAPSPEPPTDETLPAWHILLVEDDPAQRDALRHWLEGHGHVVYATGSAEEALRHLDERPCDLLLSDFGLGDEQSGVELIHAAMDRAPELRCALMTDWARAGVQSGEVDTLRARGAALLLKPLTPADLMTLVTEQPVFEPEERVAELYDLPPLRPAGGARAHPRRQLRPTLERLRQSLRASKVVLFALDTAQRRVEVVAEAGGMALSYGALSSLIYSPVRDVAEDGRLFRVDDPSRAEQRARHLRALLPFETCIAAPVSAALARRFALFAFSGREQAFGERAEEQLQATALAVAAMLEREQLLTRAADTQRLALLGQLSSALVHEMNHVLTALNFTLPNIEHLLAQGRGAGRSATQRERDEELLALTFGDLRRGLDRLTATTRMFGRVTIQSREGLVDLGETLHEALELVRDMAERQHVTLAAELAPELPGAPVPAAQLQQILLNILINAIQQIGLARPGQGGRVVLRAAEATGEEGRTLRIVVEDDGPGIHRQLWERIFELGFTTRQEGGSGLGLFISRSIAEALGVRVAVQASQLCWGTTFSIEVPIAT